ncbi:aminomethyltransferase [Corynebacterium sp. HMSC076G08]|uniref:CAF17-like 4Fe-4S cluster assembly/insertion protein YgfZ n=1 Tax=Corynebacterium sp. HMSC076G08 TaxID=1739310 RepID=UPI0008A1465A|nr:folate-binding protein YgfZ [Corynebacterium sp. HMSC076G08]OFK69349.1 aminomethyltransferase [Corynebacterium sp. HMSC076G08]
MSYSSPLLSRPGAAEFQGTTLVDVSGVPWHYGNPLVEQRAVETGSAVIDRSHRRVIAVSGPDARAFLNNLLSQKLDDVDAGFSAGALDLNIQGHVLHHMDLSFDGKTFYLDVPAAQFESLRDFLTAMVFWSQVTVEEVDVAVISVLGQALDKPSTALVERPVHWPGYPRQDFLVPRDKLDAAVQELEAQGGSLAGLMAFTAERVRAREPELAADLDAKTIAHEVPHWIRRREEQPAFVHLDKGCYRGQETVARVENLGRSPRLLVLLYLDGSAPEQPESGADITSGGRRVGRLGTVVEDCEYGPIALGLVKRSALDHGELAIGPVAASIEPDSIPVDEGPKAGRAAVDRLRGK